MKKIHLTLFFVLISASISGQELKRKALWGTRFSYIKDQGVKVQKINEYGSLFKTTIKEGDTIIKIGTIDIKSPVDYRKALRHYKSGTKVPVEIKRGDQTKIIQITPKPYPYEEESDLDINYYSLTSETGDGIRIIATQSKNSKVKPPTIIFIPWLSCGSIEKPFNRKDGWTDMFYGLAKAGFNVIRIEKPGVGDSTGPDCSEYSFDYELSVYESILKQLLTKPFVNTNELILWGGSMGGSMAPIIADDLNLNLKGIMISGSYYKTWYEHMLEIERRIAVLIGKTPSQVNDHMLKVASLYNAYLNKNQSPQQIFKKNPALKDVWSESTEMHQYGRPVQYYMEANKYNIPKYWEAVKAPALVIYGEYDWIMSKEDHTMIVDHVNGNDGDATFINVPKMDHNFNIYPTLQASFDDNSQEFDQKVLDQTIEWIQSVLK